MPRIVSLIASATEIVAALGFERDLVGRSHECDYPQSVLPLPVCTAPNFDANGSSADIDRGVKGVLRQGAAIYRVDAALLRSLRPDVIATQTQCEVCAVSLKDVKQAVASWPDGRPQIVTLGPNNMADLWVDIQFVASALDAHFEATALIKRLGQRMQYVGRLGERVPRKPTVACLEWIDPLMAAGNWVPELVAMAGGINQFGEAGKHSPAMTWKQLVERNPDVIVAMPCGLDLVRTRREMATLAAKPEWSQLKAVQKGRVYVTDGNQFFNRPGPRLVESLEILFEVLHAGLVKFGHEKVGWERLEGETKPPQRGGG
jgi:iron complex transport system substrate-binding protein